MNIKQILSLTIKILSFIKINTKNIKINNKSSFKSDILNKFISILYSCEWA